MRRLSIKSLFFGLSAFSLLLMLAASIWLYHYILSSTEARLAHTSHELSYDVRQEMMQFYDKIAYNYNQTQSQQRNKMKQSQLYFAQYGINAPLEPLKNLLRDKESEYEVYLINHDFVIEKTTYAYDLGLDFKLYPYVSELFTSQFNDPNLFNLSKPFHESSMSGFNRYMTQRAPAGKYIIQLSQSLKQDKSIYYLMNHLKQQIPTLYSHIVFTVYSKPNEPYAIRKVWFSEFIGTKKADIVKEWNGADSLKAIMSDLDPQSLPYFAHPEIQLVPYLNTIYSNNLYKERRYIKGSKYIHQVMLPYKSYYHQEEGSFSLLILEFDETQAYHEAQLTRYGILSVWFLTLGIILWMLFTFYHRIIKPISELKIQMQEKSPITSPSILAHHDEITTMARTYNWLLADLKNEADIKQTLLTQFKTFTANAIHQVRTPLSVIKIAHSMLDDQTNKEARLNILSSIVTMEHLYDSLSFTLQNEKIDLPVSNLNFSWILRERAQLFSPVASSRDSQIITDIRTNVFVEMNQSELEYLIDNNLSNALKYGQPFKPISLTLTSSPKEFILLFESYGDPISDTTAIFKRYAREDHSKAGSGIGLHIVAAICTRYQILIKVSYEDGKNCFRYFFPTK